MKKKDIGIRIIDLYIIKKFLGTYFFALLLIISIAIIFDFSEKIDEFLENGAPFHAILIEYYLNFIPYFAMLFSPLFTFIAVIYFTSKMAYNTEIIAILSSGISFHRLLVPYFISAFVLTVFAFTMNNYVIPKANAKRFIFEEKYVHFTPQNFEEKNFHWQIEPGIYVYMESYNTSANFGRRFSMEKFKNGQLKSKLIADYIQWNERDSVWMIRNFFIRDYHGNSQTITSGKDADTTINKLRPEDFSKRKNAKEALSMSELNEEIRIVKDQNMAYIELLVEKYGRISFPFSAFILTLIGISVSSRKARGGIGMQIGIGIVISFAYIVFMRFTQQFAIGGVLPPLLAMWMPNIVFAIIAVYLYKLAPK